MPFLDYCLTKEKLLQVIKEELMMEESERDFVESTETESTANCWIVNSNRSAFIAYEYQKLRRFVRNILTLDVISSFVPDILV